MKSRDQDGVVDDKLNVYGVKNLKLAGQFSFVPRHQRIPRLIPDLSICPQNVGCNTASVALIIGEKCAELVIDDLRGS